jgi:hypothetical protein
MSGEQYPPQYFLFQYGIDVCGDLQVIQMTADLDMPEAVASFVVHDHDRDRRQRSMGATLRGSVRWRALLRCAFQFGAPLDARGGPWTQLCITVYRLQVFHSGIHTFVILYDCRRLQEVCQSMS